MMAPALSNNNQPSGTNEPRAQSRQQSRSNYQSNGGTSS